MPTRWAPPWPIEFVVGAKPPWTGRSRWSETRQLSLERAQSWGLGAKGQGTDTGDMKEFPIQAPSEGNLGTCPVFLTCLAPFPPGVPWLHQRSTVFGAMHWDPSENFFLPSGLPRGSHRVPASFVAPRFCICTCGRDVPWLPGPEKEPTVPGSPLSWDPLSRCQRSLSRPDPGASGSWLRLQHGARGGARVLGWPGCEDHLRDGSGAAALTMCPLWRLSGVRGADQGAQRVSGAAP